MKPVIIKFDAFVNEDATGSTATSSSASTSAPAASNESPFSKLFTDIQQNINSIVNATKKEITQEDIDAAKGETAGDTNESLGVTFLLGTALSTGKMTSLVGKGLQKIGKKITVTEENGIFKVGKYLTEHGDKYTHAIEKFIVMLLEKLPLTAPLIKTLNPAQKTLLGKAVLTGLLIYLGIEAAGNIMHALSKGDNIMASIESLLVGTKSAEVAENIPHIIKGIISSAAEA